jgi:LysM domain-containing protein
MARMTRRSSLAGLGGLAGVGIGASVAWSLFRVVVNSASRLTGPVPPRPEEPLEFVCSTLACALLAWLTLSLAAGLAAAVPGTVGRLALAVHLRITPRILRTAIALAVGTSLSAVGGQSALASPLVPRTAHSSSAPAPVHPATSSPTPLPDPGWRPAPAPVAGTLAGDRVAVRGSVVVHDGDTLWALARRALPETAPDLVVDRGWRRIHAANRSVIGADPDLIRAGQRLVIPDLER